MATKLVLRTWVLGARPKTLVAAVVPVTVGSALAFSDDTWFVSRTVAALCVSIALQIATNYVNDYADGQRGTDNDRVGPQRLVASGLATKSEVKQAALTCFGIAGIAGLFLAFVVGPELLAVGALSMLAGWGYTGGSKPYGYYGLGELFVFIFFGVVATIGSYYVHIKSVTVVVAVASVLVGCLAVALMITNNLRDIEGDAISNKNTLAVLLGETRTRWFYSMTIVIALTCLAIISVTKPYALSALPGFAIYFTPLKQVMSGASGRQLLPVLAQSAKAQMAVGALLTVGMLL